MAGPHGTRIDLSPAPPAEVDAGTEVRFGVAVDCPEGCDLRGRAVRILDDRDRCLGEFVLTAFEEGACRAEVRLETPASAGPCLWRAAFVPGEPSDSHPPASIDVPL